ncbi:MAG: TRAP transporter small permease [Candidatus Methanomethylicus sp.]|nr:TRAP transporter small permease [Candidatus Methanomethylicus sp.]
MKYLAKFYEWVGMVSFAGAFLCLMGEIICRELFGYSIAWSGELAGIFGVWTVFCGAAAVWYKREHIIINALLYQLSDKGKAIVLFPANILVLLFAFIICYGSFDMMFQQAHVVTPAMGMNMAWLYFSLFLSSCGYILFQISITFEAFKNLRNAITSPGV